MQSLKLKAWTVSKQTLKWFSVCEMGQKREIEKGRMSQNEPMSQSHDAMSNFHMYSNFEGSSSNSSSENRHKITLERQMDE